MSSPLTTEPDLTGVLSQELRETPGALTVLGLALAARQYSLDALRRNVPELVVQGVDGAHVALIEAYAGIASQVMYRASQIPRAMLIQYLEALGLPRKDASPAVVSVYVDGKDDRQINWIEGAMVTSGIAQYTVAKTVIVPQGARNFGPVMLICTRRGPIGNLPANHNGWADVSSFGIKNIKNPQPAQGGAPAETEEEYILRATNFSGARGEAVQGGTIAAYAQSVPGVERVLVLDHTIFRNASRWNNFAFNESNWNGGAYSQVREGAVTVVVRPFGGGFLSQDLAASVGRTLDNVRPQGSVIWVASAEEAVLDVGATVKGDQTLAEVVLQSRVEDAIRAFLDGSTWAWGADFWLAELEAVIARVPGVKSVENVNVVPASQPLNAWTAVVEAGKITRIQTLVPSVLFVTRPNGVVVTVTQ